MWSPNIAGPWIFDPDREAPAVDLDAWELTYDWRERHKPTGCEFRTVLADSGHLETYLKHVRRGRLPTMERLAELAHESMLASSALWREHCEFARCDDQNRAERVPPWG